MRSGSIIACGFVAAGLLVACGSGWNERAYAEGEAMQSTAETSPYVLDFEMERLTGGKESLKAYEGKVILIVNTASRCGLTPQYEGLETLYNQHKDDGLVVLGFPANNFAGQEPGSNDEIAAFCQKNYGVSFPMFAKISVKGDDMHPLYQRLTSQPEPIGGEVTWNFQKYLVDREGNVVAKFGPRVSPGDKELVG
ncbi:MAG: glutathione peroxidase, partial [Planctomycetota bacterium]|nr:glutathione peroxidase [Planctomycetota bacterium]